MKRQMILSVVLALVVFLILLGVFYKPSIENITVGELEAINGIREGGVIMTRVQNYIIDNPNATVEDLRIIKGVNDYIINQLKKEFR